MFYESIAMAHYLVVDGPFDSLIHSLGHLRDGLSFDGASFSSAILWANTFWGIALVAHIPVLLSKSNSIVLLWKSLCLMIAASLVPGRQLAKTCQTKPSTHPALSGIGTTKQWWWCRVKLESRIQKRWPWVGEIWVTEYRYRDDVVDLLYVQIAWSWTQEVKMRVIMTSIICCNPFSDNFVWIDYLSSYSLFCIPLRFICFSYIFIFRFLHIHFSIIFLFF